MIICSVDRAGRLLSLSYGKHVGIQDMNRCLETVRNLMHRLRPGFVILSDLSHLESMDPACAHEIGTLMDMATAGGVSAIIRVMPDPSKDIGFNIISRFHTHAPVIMETHETLADAIQSLMTEHAVPAEA